MFRTAVCTFRTAERIFRTAERTFPTAEYRLKAVSLCSLTIYVDYLSSYL